MDFIQLLSQFKINIILTYLYGHALFYFEQSTEFEKNVIIFVFYETVTGINGS